MAKDIVKLRSQPGSPITQFPEAVQCYSIPRRTHSPGPLNTGGGVVGGGSIRVSTDDLARP